MNFDDAIKVHASWKGRLLNYAHGSVLDRINPDMAEKDDRCAFGRWLRDEGKALMAGQPRYDELLATHAAFHREAAALVRLIDGGQAASAQRQIADAQSAFNQASSKVVSLMMALKDDAS